MEMHGLFQRDINLRVANEGVARVWDESALVEELKEYVVTDSIEKHLLTFLAAFVESMEARKKGQGRDGMAVWISGFFGSGKSHFAKVLGHLLANQVVDLDSGQKAIDLFLPHVDASPRAGDIRQHFHQVANFAWTHPVLLEIKSKENLSNPNSVAEICLSSFYQSLGYSPAVYVARVEKILAEHGVYDQFKTYYQEQYGEAWEAGREKHIFNRQRIASGLQHCLPGEYPTAESAEKAIQDARDYESLTVESFAKELMAYLAQQRLKHPHQACHVVFVLDEVQQFIGDNGQKILELQSIVEQLGSVGKGQVWVIATGQERLDAVIDRTQIQLAQLGKMTARFAYSLHLSSEDVQRVVRDRLLVKRPSEVHVLRALYQSHEGFLADLCRLNTERQLPGVSEADFCAYYPFLPYQPTLSQDIFDTMRGIRVSGSERSMLTVTQGILKKMASRPVGALVPLDMVFDEIETELCSSDYLGSDGVRTIREADKKLNGWTVSPSRCLKALWLAQRLNWIPRSAETLARLLVDTVGEDLAAYRDKVTETLAMLQKGGYIAFEEGTGQYKYLSSEEGEVEKALLDKVGSFGTGASLVMRKAKEYARDKVLTRTKVGEYRVAYGKGGLFDFVATIDGEEVGGKGDIRIDFYGPLSTVKTEGLAQANLKQGEKGKSVYWVARPNPGLAERLKRLEALQWLTSDPSHTSGRSQKYLQAVDDKRIEAKSLEESLVKDIEDAFKEGQLFYSGEEAQLDGKKDLRAVIKDAFQTLAPNLYDRFPDADHDYDVKAIEKYLNPTTTQLAGLCPALGLFDGTNQLLTHSPLVETLLDDLARREDEGDDQQGDAILATFERIPYGWPNDLVRLVFAALLRGGAIALVTGGKKVYDYTDPAAVECLTKTTKFRATKFVSIKTGLSPAQIKQARGELVALGVTGVQESANDLARALRQEATRCIGRADKARDAIQRGLALPDTYSKVETACRPLESEDDPTVVVTRFLAQKDVWRELRDFFSALDAFVKDGKEKQFQETQALVRICRDNAPLSRSSQAEAVAKALADLGAVVAAKEIVSNWTAYRTSADALLGVYRQAYQAAYGALVTQVGTLRCDVEAMPEWEVLKAPRQAAIRQQYFDTGGKLGLPSSLPTASLPDLLDASRKYPLTTLEALESALSGLRLELQRAVQDAYAAQQEEEGKPRPKLRHWSPGEKLKGKSFTGATPPAEVDAAFAELSAEVKALVADGYTVVIE